MIEFWPIRSNAESFDKQFQNLFQFFAQQLQCNGVYCDVLDIAKIENIEITDKFFCIGFRDIVEYQPDFNYWEPSASDAYKVLDKIAQRNPKIHFVIFTEHHNVTELLPRHKNISYISCGGCMLNQPTFSTIHPVLDKNFEGSKHGICLNRLMRPHRIALVGYLYGLKLDTTMHISAQHLHKQLDKIASLDLLDHINWQFEDRHDNFKNNAIQGFEFVASNKHNFIEPEIYKISKWGTTQIFDNVGNFENSLRNLYQSTFIEIVSESWFEPPSQRPTEKFLHSVYGCNIPLIASSAGTVNLLRTFGFDMFDDIVDHSYDTISNPIDRMEKLVTDNLQLLTNPQHCKSLWVANKARFEQNVNIAKFKLYPKIFYQAELQFQQQLIN